MKVKVLLNASHSISGGGLIYLRGVLPHLAADSRFEWTLLIPEESSQHLEIPNNVKLIMHKVTSFGLRHLWEQLVLPWWARRQGFAAILCNAGYVPLLARRPVPIVHTTPRAATHSSRLQKMLYWPVLKFATKLSLLRARLAFSVSENLILDYLPKWCSEKHLKVLVAYPAADKFLAISGCSSPEQGRIVAIGDFYKHKNYATLVTAMAEVVQQVPHAKLTIVGSFFDQKVAEKVKQLVEELNLGSIVELTGGISHSETMARLRNASVAVSTSLAESFNMPVAEAITLGVPIVCTDLLIHHEVAGDAARYVNVTGTGKDAAGYAAELIKVLQHDELREQMRVAGLSRAANFSWEATAHILTAGMWSLLPSEKRKQFDHSEEV